MEGGMCKFTCFLALCHFFALLQYRFVEAAFDQQLNVLKTHVSLFRKEICAYEQPRVLPGILM